MAFAHARSGIGLGAYAPAREESVRALLVSEDRRHFPHLVKALEERNFHCRIALSCDEALELLSGAGFDLVVGVAPLPRGALLSLAGSLAGSRTSFFYAQPVEEGCWWLPIHRRGEVCFGAPALRPSEFSKLLDTLADETSNKQAESDPPQQRGGVSNLEEAA